AGNPALGRAQGPAQELATAAGPARSVSGVRTDSPSRPGVAAVWLDGRVSAVLDRSVAQIGAPAAHAAGLDGRGVTVAVLDTGVDVTHPTLAGRVTKRVNFSAEDFPGDGNGHGTHVAATVGGAGGRYTGVAPGVQLWSAKVLDSEGGGSESSVIAGMEWAASRGADVVNMSLGGAPSDGTSPLDTAVDALTARYGTLFVVAAGNAGAAGTVNTPGAADAALTVGAVDGRDVLAGFSSRGPRMGDGAVKPEITAPGVGIVAAQAKGTALGPVVEAGYVSLSGTSMATPHVAGAAAILAQAHPTWDAATLKSVLAASAKPSARASVYDQGMGRLDVASALAQDVTVDRTTLAFGSYDWPHGGDPARTRTVRYSNRGDATVTLRLATAIVDGERRPLAASALRLSHPELILTPGESAAVTVTLEPDEAGLGRWGGLVTATDMVSGRALRTALGFTKQPEEYDVTVRALDRSGRPADFPLVSLYNLDTGESMVNFELADPGRPVFRVAPGRWAVSGLLDSATAEGGAMALVVRPAVHVTGDTTVALDARKARKVTFAIPPKNYDTELVSMSYEQVDDGGGFGLAVAAEGRLALYATPTSTVTRGEVHFGAGLTARSPRVSARVTSGTDVDLDVALLEGAAAIEGRRTAAVVDRGTGEHMRDVEGRWVLVRRPPYDVVDGFVRRAAAAGARGVLLWSRDGSRAFWNAEIPRVPVLTVAARDGRLLARRARTADVRVHVAGSAYAAWTYTVQAEASGRVPSRLSFRYRAVDLARVDARFRSQGGPGTGVTYRMPDSEAGSFSLGIPGRLGAARTDWVSPGSWGSDFEVADGDEYGETRAAWASSPRAHRAGGRARETWGAALLRPAVPLHDEDGVVPVRAGDRVSGYLSPWTDRDGRMSLMSSADRVRLRMWAGARKVLDAREPFLDRVSVPSGPRRYVLRMDAAKRSASWRRSTRTSTRWGFTSASGPAATPLPLLSLDASLPLGADNATAVSMTRFTVRGRMPRGVPYDGLAALAVSASFDGGRTWRPAVVTRTAGDAFDVRVGHGRRAGAVSLRLHARDLAGNTLRQTIRDAYLVR
ncbi:MAG: S8 family serine peptidase, partial [Actinomycetota bacterium]|nr:S8 family serine peptidase [Actinomycetota bacterium]